jgi:hypothetical protein
MKKFIAFALMIGLPLIAFAQKDDKVIIPDKATSKMVLRANTRDKVAMVNDNNYQLKLQIRRQNVMKQQHKLMQQRMHKIQRNQLSKNRMIQQRKYRQEAIKRRNSQGK